MWLLKAILLALIGLAIFALSEAGAQTTAIPNETCTSFSGTIAGNISGATFDLTIDDITADDITADVITGNSFVSTCADLTCGVTLPYIAGNPSAADATRKKLVDDDGVVAISDDAGVDRPVIRASRDAGFGPTVRGVSILTTMDTGTLLCSIAAPGTTCVTASVVDYGVGSGAATVTVRACGTAVTAGNLFDAACQ